MFDSRIARATNIRGLKLDLLLRGIKINIRPDDFAPIESMQLRKLASERWGPFGPVIEASAVP
jgi:branched-chain amino acid transport system substrate-binding protein